MGVKMNKKLPEKKLTPGKKKVQPKKRRLTFPPKPRHNV